MATTRLRRRDTSPSPLPASPPSDQDAGGGGLSIDDVLARRRAARTPPISKDPGQPGPPKPAAPPPPPPDVQARIDAGLPTGYGYALPGPAGEQRTPGTPTPSRTVRARAGDPISRDPSLTPPPEPLPGEFAGSIDEEGNVTPPDIMGAADEAIGDLRTLSEEETERAERELEETEGRIGERETRTEEDIAAGIRDAEGVAQRGEDIARQGREDVAGLPGRVREDIEGIADRYRQETDVDIGHIESLGREAVGMAMEGRNTAVEAAVSAQQNSLRQAISQINADPNIPQSRKTAMIAQIRTQGSMAIAATVGANIQAFTQMQTTAMTATMNAVGTAMTARNQSMATLGTAEINAISNAHQTAADISKGYDDLQMEARTNSAHMALSYNQLRNTARDMNNTTDLAMLDNNFYVYGMPYDFRTMDYQHTLTALGDDMATQLQAHGYETMQDAMAAGEEWAQKAFFSQLLETAIGGPAGTILSLLNMFS